MVILKNGDKLNVLCIFEHKGKAFSGAKVYATIGRQLTLEFDEVMGMNGTTTITGIDDDADWQEYRVTVNIPIENIGDFLRAKPGSNYSVQAKLTNIPGPSQEWKGPLNDITLVQDIGDAEFRDLAVTYNKA